MYANNNALSIWALYNTRADDHKCPEVVLHVDQKCGEVALHANKNAENRMHANKNAENRIPTKTIAKTVVHIYHDSSNRTRRVRRRTIRRRTMSMSLRAN